MDLQALVNQLKAAGQLADFLEALGATTGLFNCSTSVILPEGPYGILYLRQMTVDQVGAAMEGHQHHYDHVTFINRGKVVMTTWKADANGERHPGTLKEEIFQAPAQILIRKENFHKFTALTDDVILQCVYAIRDKDGNFAESWDGSRKAYT